MSRYQIARFLLGLSLPALVLAGCGPVAPVVRDGMGRSLPINNAAVSTIEPVGFPGVFTKPLDAAPDPQGKTIYVVGESASGPGLFDVPGNGGPVTPIVVGAPFDDPTGVAVAIDGSTVYIADGKSQGQGAIFSVDLNTGDVKTVEGTEGLAPRGLEVASINNSNYIYFSGKTTGQASGQPAIYRIATTGGKAEMLASGGPLVDPVGVAVAADGTVYTADRQAGGNDLGAAFRIDNDKQVNKIADGFKTGDRVAGATLTPDDKVLLISAFSAE